MLPEHGEGIVKRLAGHEFGGVGRNFTARKHVKIGRHLRLVAQRKQVKPLGRSYVLGYSGRFLGQVEHLVEHGLADVHAHEQRLALHEGEADGQVGGREALALAGRG